jgi:hypothetical protein
MSEDNTIPISVIALRADDYSLDGKDLIISLTTKYSAAERKYSVPVECFHDLIVDLRRLSAAAAATTSIETPIQPDVAPNPADDLNRLTISASDRTVDVSLIDGELSLADGAPFPKDHCPADA